jgi:hypothetical protein
MTSPDKVGPFTLERRGDKWAVTSGREDLILTRTKREARKTAVAAVEILDTSATHTQSLAVPLGEYRSFDPPE